MVVIDNSAIDLGMRSAYPVRDCYDLTNPKTPEGGKEVNEFLLRQVLNLFLQVLPSTPFIHSLDICHDNPLQPCSWPVLDTKG